MKELKAKMIDKLKWLNEKRFRTIKKTDFVKCEIVLKRNWN